MFLLSLGLERTARMLVRRRGWKNERDVRDPLLSPFKVSLDLLRCLHAVGKIGPGTLQAPLSESLQFK